MVLKLVRLEVTGLLLDDMLSKIEHVLGYLYVLNVFEMFGLVAHFVGIAEQHPHETLVPRFKRDDMFATGEHNAAQRHFVKVADCFADDSEGVMADLSV